MVFLKMKQMKIIVKTENIISFSIIHKKMDRERWLTKQIIGSSKWTDGHLVWLKGGVTLNPTF